MKKTKTLDETQIKRLLNGTKLTRHSDRNRLIVCLSFYSGMRSIEICSLNVGDVIDREGKVKDVIYLDKTQTKGRERQTVYISTVLQGEIQKYLDKYSYLKERRGERLIQSQKGGGFTSMTLQRVFKELYKIVGLDDCSSHTGRKTFCTELGMKGVSVRVIQELMRHKNLQTTQMYMMVSDDKLKNSVEVLGY